LSLSRSTGESSKSLDSTSARPYVSKHPLTQTELIFYNRLVEAMDFHQYRRHFLMSDLLLFKLNGA
jgi:hypothetical protein